MKSYHLVWLQKHPVRTAEWMADKLKDGFHIHHLDGDHGNDHPDNLILIEGVDHLALHGMKIRKINNGDSQALRKARAKGRKRYKRPIGPIKIEAVKEIMLQTIMITKETAIIYKKPAGPYAPMCGGEFYTRFGG